MSASSTCPRPCSVSPPPDANWQRGPKTEWTTKHAVPAPASPDWARLVHQYYVLEKFSLTWLIDNLDEDLSWGL